jgi:hypothetical protein
LEIVRKTKETKKWKVVVSFQIMPAPKKRDSVGIVRYTDKESGQVRRWQFKLKLHDDIYPLVGTIGVSHGIITLRPRSSVKADVYTKRYKTPITVPIEEMEVEEVQKP